MSLPYPPPPSLQYDVSELTVVDFYGYSPSIVLASVALALFFTAGVFVSLIVLKKKNSKFMHVVGFTGLLEAAGYASLIYSIQKSGQSNIYGSYVITQVFVILSPNFLQGTNYFLLGTLIALSRLGEGSKFLKRGCLTCTFVTADLLALVVQAIGIVLWATSKGSGNPNADIIRIGNYITVAGLAFQLISFLIFVVVVIWTHRHPRNTLKKDRGFRQIYALLYITTALVTIRNIYRFVEFLQQALLTWPFDNTYVISEQQALFYGLDTLPILLSFAFYIILHPAFHLPFMHHLSSEAGVDTLKIEEGNAVDTTTKKVEDGVGVLDEVSLR